MDALQLVRVRLGTAKAPQLRLVADESGVPFDTLVKVARGQTKNPRYETMEKLRRYLERRAA